MPNGTIAESLTKEDATRFIEHVRLSHFTLVVTCVGLIIATLATASSPLQRASKDFVAIAALMRHVSAEGLRDLAQDEAMERNRSGTPIDWQHEDHLVIDVTTKEAHQTGFPIDFHPYSFSHNIRSAIQNFRSSSNEQQRTLSNFREFWDQIAEPGELIVVRDAASILDSRARLQLGDPKESGPFYDWPSISIRVTTGSAGTPAIWSQVLSDGKMDVTWRHDGFTRLVAQRAGPFPAAGIVTGGEWRGALVCRGTKPQVIPLEEIGSPGPLSDFATDRNARFFAFTVGNETQVCDVTNPTSNRRYPGTGAPIAMSGHGDLLVGSTGSTGVLVSSLPSHLGVLHLHCCQELRVAAVAMSDDGHRMLVVGHPNHDLHQLSAVRVILSDRQPLRTETPLSFPPSLPLASVPEIEKVCADFVPDGSRSVVAWSHGTKSQGQITVVAWTEEGDKLPVSCTLDHCGSLVAVAFLASKEVVMASSLGVWRLNDRLEYKDTGPTYCALRGASGMRPAIDGKSLIWFDGRPQTLLTDPYSTSVRPESAGIETVRAVPVTRVERPHLSGMEPILEIQSASDRDYGLKIQIPFLASKLLAGAQNRIHVDLQRRLAREVNRPDWRLGKFDETFPDLAKLSAEKNWSELPLQQLKVIFAALIDREAREGEKFEAFGMKIPAFALRRAGLILLVAVQFYLAQHLRMLPLAAREARVAWIGLYEDFWSKVGTFATVTVLPVVAACVLILAGDHDTIWWSALEIALMVMSVYLGTLSAVRLKVATTKGVPPESAYLDWSL